MFRRQENIFGTPWEERFPTGGGKGITGKVVSATPRVPPATNFFDNWLAQGVKNRACSPAKKLFCGTLGTSGSPPEGGKDIFGKLVSAMSRVPPAKKNSKINRPGGGIYSFWKINFPVSRGVPRNIFVAND